MSAKEFLESRGYEFYDKDFWMEEPVTEHKFRDLIDLMEEYAALRDSRQLSAVPSEEWKQIFREIWDIGNELAGADNPEDFFEIEFEKWKTKRGIAG